MPEVMIAVADNGGRIRWQVSVVKALASALCIGSGGSVGREGPIVQIGSALASSIGQWVRLPENRLRIMVACGAAGGISATIYTAKLLRRGTDLDQAVPWRAVADLKITDVMRPFRPALPVPADGHALATVDGQASAGERHDEAALPGRVTYRHELQALFASESLGQALRQLAVYGRDGLPVVSPDARELDGWVTSAGVLRALAHRVAGTAAETARAQAAADSEHEEPQAMAQHPSVPLPGYYVAEIVITPDSPAAGRKLGEAGWPTASVPVSVLRGGSLRRPHRDITLDVGDRVSLLIPAPKDSPPPHSGSGGRDRAASLEAGHGSSA